MSIDTIRVPDALRPGTKEFLTSYADAIEARLGDTHARMDRALTAHQLPQLPEIRQRFLAARRAWEKHFWVRVADHLAAGDPLDRAVALADEDILALSTLVDAL